MGTGTGTPGGGRARSVTSSSVGSTSAATGAASNNKEAHVASSNASLLGSSTATAEARKRAAKRDAALRARFERGSSKGGNKGGNVAVPTSSPSAVTGLKPNPAVIVRETQTVTEAARIMVSHRADAVLVVDGGELLVGILTDKDISFRVIADNKDPDKLAVLNVMTPNPSYGTIWLGTGGGGTQRLFGN